MAVPADPSPLHGAPIGRAAACHRYAPPGVTLIEVIVALVVTGVIALAVHATASLAGESLARAERARTDALTAATARATLRDWLRSAAVFEGGGPFEAIDAVTAGVPYDELTFAIPDGGPLRPGPRRVRLRVERRTSSSRSGLIAEVSPIGLRAGEPVETLRVAPAARGLSLRYRTTEEGARRWLAEWRSTDRPPEAVELRLIDRSGAARAGGDDDDERLPALLRLPLVVRIEAAAP